MTAPLGPLLLLLAALSGVLSQCSYDSDGYHVEWEYDSSSQLVHFDLTAAQPAQTQDFWTGIAFGGGMWDLDAIVVSVLNGQSPTVSDMFSRSYGPPQRDANSHVQVDDVSLNNGVVNARFSRPMSAADDEDKTLRGCQKFYFPQSAGPLSGRSIGKHFRTPDFRDICDIETNCARSVPGQPEITEPPPTRTEPPLVPPTRTQILVADDCNFETEDYSLRWDFDGTYVNFELSARPVDSLSNYWTGVGFGDAMSDMDMLLVLVDSRVQTAQIGDYYSQAYEAPQLDSRQDVLLSNDATQFVDDRIVARFSRQIDTGDAQDKSLLGCTTFQLPVSAGRIAEGPKLLKHSSKPLRHVACNIDSRCRNAPVRTEATTLATAPPTQPTDAPSTQPPVPVSACRGAADLDICQSYFEEYFARVDEWASLHGFEASTQYGRACQLVSAVDGVQSYCCNIFDTRCALYGPF